MAPEAIVDGRYSVKSDVWAFGVVLWEIFSYGVTPYTHFGNLQVIEKVVQGHRLEPPAVCPSLVVVLMQQCWETDPDSRPDFETICKSLTIINARRARGSLDPGLMLDEEVNPKKKRASKPSTVSNDSSLSTNAIHEGHGHPASALPRIYSNWTDKSDENSNKGTPSYSNWGPGDGGVIDTPQVRTGAGPHIYTNWWPADGVQGSSSTPQSAVTDPCSESNSMPDHDGVESNANVPNKPHVAGADPNYFNCLPPQPSAKASDEQKTTNSASEASHAADVKQVIRACLA